MALGLWCSNPASAAELANGAAKTKRTALILLPALLHAQTCVHASFYAMIRFKENGLSNNKMKLDYDYLVELSHDLWKETLLSSFFK